MVRLFFISMFLFFMVSFPSIAFSAPTKITYVYGEKDAQPLPSSDVDDDFEEEEEEKNICEQQGILDGIICGEKCCTGWYPYCSAEKNECAQCPDGKYYTNGICCPHMQVNSGGVCVCEIRNKTVCGDSCCVEGETCYDNTTCCAGVLCGTTCCSTDEVCGSNNTCVCSNGNAKNSSGYCCPEGQVEVDYFDKTGIRRQACCEQGSKGADWGGNCCPEGEVGTFGHNHSSKYISRCCPIEGQEDKGMIGLHGLSETYACAPPDTTMAASGMNSGSDHAWYVPIGSDNVNGSGTACGPGTNPRSYLHEKCATGYYCKHNASSSGCYCSGMVENGKCILPDCTLKRQHVAYCYCNPENGSVLEDTYQGGTWGSDYARDICVTPQTDKTDLTKEELCKESPQTTYWNSVSKTCATCEGWHHYQGVLETDCTCSNRFWRTDKWCIECKRAELHPYVPKVQCQKCPNRYWYSAGTDVGYCGLCPNDAKSFGDGKACVCPSGKFWNRGGGGDSNICSVCSATVAVYAPKESCHLCDNQFAIVNPTDGWERCYGCDDGVNSTAAVNKTTLAECKRCPKRYLDKNKYCRICANGYYCPLAEDGADAIVCPVGNYCPQGSHEPTPCPTGTYRAATGAYAVTHCVACPVGKVPNAERSACI